jgi:membrane-associated phospholipid phosphatase
MITNGRQKLTLTLIAGLLLLLPFLLVEAVAAEEFTSEGQPSGALELSQEPLSGLRDDWLVGGFDRSSRWITAGLTVGLGVYLGSADTADVRVLGDITQLLPGVFALTSNLLTGDREGLKQFGYAGATTLVATHGLKELVNKTRPDDSEDNSFPSGHTSASVLGAAYVWRRYGAKWGAPASVLAAYTGVSRIEGQKHFADDVISGAAIGLISNWLWTDPIDERVQLSLFPTRGGAGLQVTYDPSASRQRRSGEIVDSLPNHFFLWETGLADVRRNSAASPNAGGSVIDWRFDQENNPNVTAFISAGWRPSPESRHLTYVGFSPFEVRESFDNTEDIDFAGESFVTGSLVRSRYVANDYRVGYGYSLFDTPRYALTLGASLTIFDSVLELASGDTLAKVSTTTVKPTVGLRFEAAPADRWLFFAGYNAWHDTDVSIDDFTAQLAFRIDNSWALSLGYRRIDRQITVDELFNNVRRDQIAVGVWYLW